MESTNDPYFYPPISQQPAAVLPEIEPSDIELSRKKIGIHSALLAITAVTTTLTGAAWTIKLDSPPTSFIGSVLAPHIALFKATAAGHFGPLGAGLLFTFTLLTILGAHEFGHYFACRHYGIRATLPFFVPAPPMPLTPFGTFGAVIRIKEPIRSRRALFDIGIAGPLAGFALAVPAAVLGLAYATAAQPVPAGTPGMELTDPLLFIIIGKIFGVPKMVDTNPVYLAAWAVMLVTSLNLFPVGQLDGGHVVFAVAGQKLHKWISWITFVGVASLAVTSYLLYHSPIWFLWTFVLLFLLKVGHPPTVINEPLGGGRKVLAVVAAIVFVLCFMATPIKIL
ncbi:MAG TPA: site-2 protease family protein [Blastocatellia bacterium]|nr:site-2 protease family protein [Blastocatellia bacterium]